MIHNFIGMSNNNLILIILLEISICGISIIYERSMSIRKSNRR